MHHPRYRNTISVAGSDPNCASPEWWGRLQRLFTFQYTPDESASFAFAQLPDLSGVIHRPPEGRQLTGKKYDSFNPPTGSNRLANSHNPEFIDAYRVVESYPAVTATPRRGPTAKPVVLYYACCNGWFIGIWGWVEKILVFLWWLFGK